MKEMNILRRIMIAASNLGSRLFRNNCGVLRDIKGNYIKYGVANPGGSDLIGWTPRVIMPKDVGCTIAVFTAIEVKDEDGKLTDEQAQFLHVVRESGGIAIEAHDVETVEIALMVQR